MSLPDLQDVVWSKVTVTQIIGRAHRMGQKKPVHVYELMALGTTDAVMATLAAGKDMMLNALLSKHPNKGTIIFSIHVGLH